MLRHKLRKVASEYLTHLLIFLLTVFYTFHDITKWSIMKSLGAQGPILYVDSSTVLHYSRCFENIGIKVFLNGEICSNWNYSTSLLRLIGVLELQNTNEQLIGKMFTYFLLLSFCVLLYLLRGHSFAQVTLFLGLISPPVWLLIERGNFDTVIYLLIFLSALIYAQGYKIISILLISISSILKFYTLPLLFFIWIKSRGFYLKLFSSIIFLVSVVLIAFDLRLLDKNNVIQAGNNHFGLKIIGNYLGKLGIEIYLPAQYLLSGFFFFASIVITYLIVLRFPFVHLNNPNLSKLKILYLFNFVVFISMYLTGLSVDYKLIFAMTTAPFLIIHSQRKFRFLVLLLFLFSVWFTYLTGFFQTIGDFTLQIYMAIQIVFILQATNFQPRIRSIYVKSLKKFKH